MHLKHKKTCTSWDYHKTT